MDIELILIFSDDIGPEVRRRKVDNPSRDKIIREDGIDPAEFYFMDIKEHDSVVPGLILEHSADFLIQENLNELKEVASFVETFFTIIRNSTRIKHNLQTFFIKKNIQKESRTGLLMQRHI